jgi:ubiquinone/menaquinone biosynthesis C-methylase UbiE
MNIEDMYRWWNDAALSNPMTAILSNEIAWDKGKFFQTGVEWLESHRQFAAAAGVELRGHSALDFGCGIGRMTAALSRYFERAIGVDISDEMIRLADSLKSQNGIEFVLVKEAPLPFENMSVDCVYSTIVVQHIPFPYNLQYVSEFFRLSSSLVLFDAPSHKLRASDAEPTGGIFMLNREYVFATATQYGFDLMALRNFPATNTRQYQYLFKRR